MSESKFKVGDTVYSLSYGEGKVMRASKEGDIDVVFEKAGFKRWYTPEGFPDDKAVIPEIYLTKPEIIIPKMKVKREIKRWVIVYPEEIGYKTHHDAKNRAAEYRGGGFLEKPIEATITWEEEIEG